MPVFIEHRKLQSTHFAFEYYVAQVNNQLNISRMEKYLEEVFKHLNGAYKSLESRLKAEGFKARVLQVLKAWDEWLVYDREFITRMKTTFLGIPNVSSLLHMFFWGGGGCFLQTISIKSIVILQIIEKPVEPEPSLGSDGEKDDEDLDGVPLDGAALLKSAYMRGIPGATSNSTDSPPQEKSIRSHENHESDYDDDIDGIPREYKRKKTKQKLCRIVLNIS